MSDKKKLLKKLRKALLPHKGKYPRIAERTGISYTTITHIALDQYPHCPSHLRVRKLLKVLSRMQAAA